MIVRDIVLRNFRNHAESFLTFADGINVLLGANGQGKTNILEAVSFLALTKSFYASSDLHVLKLGSPGFTIEARIHSDGGTISEVRVAFSAEPPEKVVTVGGVRPEKLSDLIGQFPTVILSPEHARITAGTPADRRKFVDILLSQLSAAYLGDLMEYRRVHRQRNALLGEMRASGRQMPDALEPWTASLCRIGGRIIARRAAVLGELDAYVRSAYEHLVPEGEAPAMRYATVSGFGAGSTADDAAACLSVVLAEQRTAEIQRGTTLSGPHRDDVLLSLNGVGVHNFASQGQHKTFLVALKLAEHTFIKDRRNEVPLLLLDDLFSELDDQRVRRILLLVEGMGQSVITTTDQSPFHGMLAWSGRHRKFDVQQGTIIAPQAEGAPGAYRGSAGKAGAVDRD